MSYRRKPYEFRFEGIGTSRHIYACFCDHHHKREIEIGEELHLELVLLNRSVRNMESAEERHSEFRDLSEEEQAERGAPTNPSAEEDAFRNLLIEQLKAAFLAIPAVQARRYLLAHEFGYSYAEIARMECCSTNAVKKSLIAAKRNLQEILRNRVPETPSEFGRK
jgi:RNA polymerase sigma-70 factor (ECF subfamily)